MLQGSIICKDINRNLRDVISRYESNEKEIETLTKLRQDILHEIESSKYDIQRGYKAYVEIREMSISRRRLKSENRSIEPLYKWLKDNNKILNNIGNIQGDCRKQEECVTNAQYKARVKTEIEEMVNTQIKENGVKFDENEPDFRIRYADHKDKIRLTKEMKLKWHKISIDSDKQEVLCWRSKIK